MRIPSLTMVGTSLGLALAMALVLTGPQEATAGEGVWSWFGHNYRTDHHDDGTRTEYYDDNGDIYSVFYDANDEYEGWYDINEGDPNPDDSDSGIGPDKDAIIEALKRLGGAPYEFTPEFWVTPIGRDLAENGVGGFTVTNPPPEYNPGGLGYEDEQGFGGGGGNGGFDPMGGSPKDSIRQSAGKGSNGDDDDDDSDPAPSHQGETFAGPPEYVNPPPIPLLTLRTVNLQPNISMVVGN